MLVMLLVTVLSTLLHRYVVVMHFLNAVTVVSLYSNSLFVQQTLHMYTQYMSI